MGWVADGGTSLGGLRRGDRGIEALSTRAGNGTAADIAYMRQMYGNAMPVEYRSARFHVVRLSHLQFGEMIRIRKRCTANLEAYSSKTRFWFDLTQSIHKEQAKIQWAGVAEHNKQTQRSLLFSTSSTIPPLYSAKPPARTIVEILYRSPPLA